MHQECSHSDRGTGGDPIVIIEGVPVRRDTLRTCGETWTETQTFHQHRREVWQAFQRFQLEWLGRVLGGLGDLGPEPPQYLGVAEYGVEDELQDAGRRLKTRTGESCYIVDHANEFFLRGREIRIENIMEDGALGYLFKGRRCNRGQKLMCIFSRFLRDS